MNHIKYLLMTLIMFWPVVSHGQRVAGIPPLYEADAMPTCNADREGLKVRANADSADDCLTVGTTVNMCECVGSTWTDTDKVSVVSQTAGAIIMNTVTLVTAPGDYTIADTECEDAGDIGNWFTLVLEGDSVVVVIKPLD